VDLALVAGYVATGACTPTVLGMNVPVVHPRKDARSAGSKPAENRLLPQFRALGSGDSTLSHASLATSKPKHIVVQCVSVIHALPAITLRLPPLSTALTERPW